MPGHFSGRRRYLYEYSDLFLVHCPRCERCARVVPFGDPGEIRPPNRGTSEYYRLVFAPRRLTCEYCGYVKEWKGKRIAPVEGHDWYFGCRLWLKGPCCGEELWAFNPRHLQFLEEFVRADFRETHYNATLASRLPEWMKLGRNRDEVLRCIKKVRALLVSEAG